MNSSDLNNFIKVPVSLQDSFFKYWVEFLWPIHRLCPSEMDILACFLKERYALSKKIADDRLLDTVIFSTRIRRKILEDCGITGVFLSTKLGKFKKQGIIKDGRINPRLIPNVKEEKGNFKLLLYFDFKEDDKVNKASRTVKGSGKKA